MEGTTVDPRMIAKALLIGTCDLARVPTTWAGEAMPTPNYDHAWEPMALEDFDYAVERARYYLVAAHEAQKAWEEDNPREEIEDE